MSIFVDRRCKSTQSTLPGEHAHLTLPLLMPRVSLTNDAQHTISAYHDAMFTNSLNARSHFHRVLQTRFHPVELTSRGANSLLYQKYKINPVLSITYLTAGTTFLRVRPKFRDQFPAHPVTRRNRSIPRDNTPPIQIVRRHFNRHFVPWQNTDVINPHFSGYVRQQHMSVFELHAKHRVRQGLCYQGLQAYGVFLRHSFPQQTL